MPPAARNSTTRILPIFSPTSGRRDEVPGCKGGEEGATDAIRAIQEEARAQYTSSPDRTLACYRSPTAAPIWVRFNEVRSTGDPPLMSKAAVLGFAALAAALTPLHATVYVPVG